MTDPAFEGFPQNGRACRYCARTSGQAWQAIDHGFHHHVQRALDNLARACSVPDAEDVSIWIRYAQTNLSRADEHIRRLIPGG